MKREEFEVWCAGHGYEKDRYGHFKKEKTGGLVRYKLAGLSVRYERQYTVPADQYSPERRSWAKVWSAYYKDLSVNVEGKLVIGRKIP